MLLNNPELAPEARGKLARALQGSARQMRRLIDDLLDFVEIELGRLRVSKRVEEPVELLEDLRAKYEALARERGITLEWAVDKTVTAVECDRERLLRVLGDWLDNALRFTRPGGRVGLNLTRAGGNETLVYVSDTGPTIPSAQLAHVFDRYWSRPEPVEADGTHAGIGLGLAVAKGVIEAHGGRVSGRRA